MTYFLKIEISCWHKPTKTWDCFDIRRGVRACGRKHAINKGLKIGVNLPIYKDRSYDDDWLAALEVSIVEDGWRA